MKKIKIILLFIVLSVIGISLIYKNKDSKMSAKNNLAIMVKNESGEYVSSNSIPTGDYVLNEDKTFCENGGKVKSYDSSTGQIGFSFLGSDRCSLYFDIVLDEENPTITNLSVSGTTVTLTLSDNNELSSYGISTSNTVEPTSWTSISGSSYNLNTSITTKGIYYIWVKDSVGNKSVSEAIDLETKGWETILLNNSAGATTVDSAKTYIEGKTTSTTPDFSTTATTNEGMYVATDDLGTSYYFRGAVDNNWIKFGKDSSGNDIYWRIIRINGDGSIRMIYSGTTAPTSSTAVVMTDDGTQIGKSNYNSNFSNPSYVGYMYKTSVQHGLDTSSTIKTTIDNWYATTTLETDATTKSLVADQIFCNDRTASTSSTGTPGEISGSMSDRTTYYFGSPFRYNNPILTCPSESDKFTVNESNGNGKLTYPVGLITFDEAIMAGGDGHGESANTSYYLYTSLYYWLGSPYSSNLTFGAMVGAIYSYGNMSNNKVTGSYGVRPVISLSAKAKLSGSGTYNDVYTVS